MAVTQLQTQQTINPYASQMIMQGFGELANQRNQRRMNLVAQTEQYAASHGGFANMLANMGEEGSAIMNQYLTEGLGYSNRELPKLYEELQRGANPDELLYAARMNSDITNYLAPPERDDEGAGGGQGGNVVTGTRYEPRVVGMQRSEGERQVEQDIPKEKRDQFGFAWNNGELTDARVEADNISPIIGADKRRDQAGIAWENGQPTGTSADIKRDRPTEVVETEAVGASPIEVTINTIVDRVSTDALNTMYEGISSGEGVKVAKEKFAALDYETQTTQMGPKVSAAMASMASDPEMQKVIANKAASRPFTDEEAQAIGISSGMQADAIRQAMIDQAVKKASGKEYESEISVDKLMQWQERVIELQNEMGVEGNPALTQQQMAKNFYEAVPYTTVADGETTSPGRNKAASSQVSNGIRKDFKPFAKDIRDIYHSTAVANDFMDTARALRQQDPMEYYQRFGGDMEVAERMSKMEMTGALTGLYKAQAGMEALRTRLAEEAAQEEASPEALRLQATMGMLESLSKVDYKNLQGDMKDVYDKSLLTLFEGMGLVNVTGELIETGLVPQVFSGGKNSVRLQILAGTQRSAPAVDLDAFNAFMANQ